MGSDSKAKHTLDESLQQRVQVSFDHCLLWYEMCINIKCLLYYDYVYVLE